MKDYAKQDFLKEIFEEESKSKTRGPAMGFGPKEARDKVIKDRMRAEMEHTLLQTIREYRAEFGTDALKSFIETQALLPF